MCFLLFLKKEMSRASFLAAALRPLGKLADDIVRASKVSNAVAAINKVAVTEVKASMKSADINTTGFVNKLATKAASGTPGAQKGAKELSEKVAEAAKDAGKDLDSIPARMKETANKIADKMPPGGTLAAAVSLLTTLLVTAGVIAIVKSYADKADEEREVCLADWTVKYIDVLTRPDGTLHKIDTPEEWTQSIKDIQDHIYSLKEVNKDEAKAKAFLSKMNDGLMECLGTDTSAIGATLSGLSRDTGNAVKNILTGATDPLNDTVDSLSENVKIILIAVGAVIGAIILLLIVYYFTSTKPGVVDMRNRHKELMLSQYNRAIALPRRLRDGVANRSRRQQYRRLLE